MKFDPDDPQWTAYALGEGDDITRASLAAYLQGDAEARRAVDQIRAVAAALEAELAGEQSEGLGPERLEALIAQAEGLVPGNPMLVVEDADNRQGKTPVYHVLTHPGHERREARRFLAIAGMAAAVVFALATLAVLLPGRRSIPVAVTPPESPHPIVPFLLLPGPVTSPPGGPASPTADAGAWDQRFTDARLHPVSTFPLNSSTASYAEVRRSIAAGHLPDPDSVRIEEMVNAFAYHYPAPSGDAVFAADIEIAACPWEAEHRLVRIGLKARQADPLAARDATARVEFNPGEVNAYRLIGSAHRQAPGAASGSDIAGGQTITALYEVAPAEPSAPLPSQRRPLLTLTLHYLPPGGGAPAEQQFAAVDNGQAWAQASEDFRFAAAVATFGLVLGGARRGTASFDGALQLALSGSGRDQNASRAEFADLVQKARELKRA